MLCGFIEDKVTN